MSKFGAKTTALEVVEGLDLTNRDYIVTGATSGIGVETVRALAKAGARVTMAVRDTEKGERIAKEIREFTSDRHVEVEKLDLDSLESVADFVKRFLAKKIPLHGLVNNAGIMACPRTYTIDGFEAQFGINHMGHFALTFGLLPVLIEGYKQSGKKSRVVNVSSIAHAEAEIDFDDVNFRSRKYDPWTAYSQSKVANVLFSVALSELYSKDGVVSNAAMSGIIKTGLQKYVPEDVQRDEGWFDEKWFMNPLVKSVEQGASTQVWAVVAPELEGIGGQYFENCAYSKMSNLIDISTQLIGYTAYAVNKDIAMKLWELSMNLLKSPPS